MALSIMDIMDAGRQAAAQGRERGKQTYLGKLAGQAYGAAPDQQRGIVQQAITTNPDAGFSLAGALGKTQDRDFSQLGQAAAIFSTIPDEQKQEFYASKLAPLAKQAGYPVPETYDPRFQQAIDKIAQIGGGGGQGDELKSLRIGANGNYWAIRGGQFVDTGTPAAPTNQVIDTGNGFFGVDKRTLNAAPVVVGGQQPQQQRAPGEVPFSIDPSLPPQVQASIRANESAFAAVPDGGQVQIGPQGGGEQLRSVPKPQEQGDVFVPLSQDEVSQMGLPPGTIAQRNLKTGKVEFAPAGVQSVEKPMSEFQRQQLQAKTGKAKAALGGTVSDLDRMGDAVRKVMNSKGLDRITGVLGALPNIPGGDAANAEADLDALKSQIAFAVLAKMRAMSPTGGALGSVSDAEGKRLEANLAALDKAQSADQMRARLQDILDYIESSKGNLRDAYNEQFGEQGRGASREAPQSNSVLRYNPATGDFE